MARVAKAKEDNVSTQRLQRLSPDPKTIPVNSVSIEMTRNDQTHLVGRDRHMRRIRVKLLLRILLVITFP